LNKLIVIYMRKYVVKTRKVRGAIVVTLPKKLVEAEQIRENMFVEITVNKCRKDGFGMLKGLSPFTIDDELKAHE